MNTYAQKWVTEEQLKAVLQDYEKWRQSLPAETSTLNHRLCILKLLVEASGDSGLKEDSEVVSAFLKGSGIREVGDTFERVSQDGNKKIWTVISQKIGPQNGVMMELRSESGDLQRHEFLD